MQQDSFDVFISYSRNDYVDKKGRVIPGNHVSRIKNALDNANISYWFDEEGISYGQNFIDQIVSNIENSRIFIFLSSQNSNQSKWTSKEIACADELGKYIIPVRLDDAPYNKKVLFRISDLNYIEYHVNPDKGISSLIETIKETLPQVNKQETDKQENEEQTTSEKTAANSTYSPSSRELTRWNWGAFFFNIIWGFFNLELKSPFLLCSIFLWMTIALGAITMPLLFLFVLFIANFSFSFFYGLFGTRWAWKSMKEQNWLKFQKTQKRWNYAALLTFLIDIVLLPWYFYVYW